MWKATGTQRTAIRRRVPVVLLDEIEHFRRESNRRESYVEPIKKARWRRPYKPDSVPREICAHAGVIISLGLELPRTSSDLPEDLGRASLSADS